MALIDKSRVSEPVRLGNSPIIQRELTAPTRTGRMVGVSIVFLMALILLSGLVSLNAPQRSTSGQLMPVRASYVNHSPIFIYGDAGFEGANSTTGVTWGSGTESDPYIIEGWMIVPVGDIGILVEDTTVHFVIRNCIASNMGPIGDGIHLSNCANCTVADNELTASANGIFASGLVNCTISGNNCSNNLWEGIVLFDSYNTTVVGNTVSGNGEGIALYSSSDSNMIISNEIRNSIGYAVRIESGSDNAILNNTFAGNNGAAGVFDPEHVQASDNGTFNLWDKGAGTGNYWSDWTLPDDDMDGIVDSPYAIGGTASAADHYPRTTAPPIPEFGSATLCISALIGLAVVVRRARTVKHYYRP